MRRKALLSEIAKILGLTQQELVLKLLTINALLLEEAKREGVSPKEFFEGCVYVSENARNHLSSVYGEGWKSEVKDFLERICRDECEEVEEPLEEALYYVRKVGVEKLYGLCKKEFVIYVENKKLDELVKVANQLLSAGLLPQKYEEELGRRINELVVSFIERETKILKDKALRAKLKAKA